MGFFKNLMLRQMLKSQLKDVPKEQQEKVISAIEKNPQFFEDIAKKIEQKTKEGKDQMSATMEVMRENQDELRKMMM
jgi:hypothetical protein